VNVEAIANLSGILRDNIIRSHDKFQEITRDILWLNLTIHGQNELYTSIREMEFSILRLTQQLDELINAIQFMIMEKLPVNLINPIVLHRILKNVSFNLPDSYDLVAGTRIENIHLYYDIIKVTAIANAHQIKMVMDVPF
jgi:regulator of replication initiation timing